MPSALRDRGRRSSDPQPVKAMRSRGAEGTSVPPDDLEEWSGESFTPDQTNLRRSSECFRMIQQGSGRRAEVERPICSLSKRPEAHSSTSL